MHAPKSPAFLRDESLDRDIDSSVINGGGGISPNGKTVRFPQGFNPGETKLGSTANFTKSTRFNNVHFMSAMQVQI